VYNALGQRVEKQTGSAYTEVVYDAFGSPIAYHNGTGWDTYFVPLGGRPFVRYQDQKTYFLHPNNLGSTAFVTDETGATIQKTIYYPWGQAWASAGTLKDNRFASLQPRDAETGNDSTLFRMYNPRLYRWLSPDPPAGSI
jgi:RHS repeat-associated protein